VLDELAGERMPQLMTADLHARLLREVVQPLLESTDRQPLPARIGTQRRVSLAWGERQPARHDGVGVETEIDATFFAAFAEHAQPRRLGRRRRGQHIPTVEGHHFPHPQAAAGH
jgi:hypothetical protein